MDRLTLPPIPSTGPSAAELARAQLREWAREQERERERYLNKVRAVRELTDESELARIAIMDNDRDIRREAAGQLTDEEQLRRVYSESSDEEILILVVWKLRGVVSVDDSTPEAVQVAVRDSQAVEIHVVDLEDNVTMELAKIPVGEFQMGSPSDEEGRRDDEGPQRKVPVLYGYLSGDTGAVRACYGQ